MPLSNGAECVDKMDDQLVLLSYGEDAAPYELYRDDGYSRDYDNPDNWSFIS